MISFLLALLALPAVRVAGAEAEPGAPNGPGLAIHAAKILVLPADPDERQVVDRGTLLVRDGRIEAVGRRGALEVPEGYEVFDAGDRWLMPGLVELHAHVGGTFDINDMVYLANPGLRVSPAVIPANDALRRGLAAGVTTVLFIPGSGTNIGGQGVVFKTGPERYEDALVRDPGALKLAQWGNPESWATGVSMSFENWNTRNVLRRGVEYAKAWQAFEADEGPEPELDLELEPFRDLLSGEMAIATHTQVYQVVLMTLTMVHDEFGLPVFLDHSTIGGWLAGGLAAERDVPAIVGPRSIDPTASRGMLNWARNRHEGFRGVAAGYQERGVPLVGFNTDSPVIPQEELQLQAAMGVRYGFADEALQAVRGLTIVPAVTARIDGRVGSLEPGKDADVLVVTGHVADPRTEVERAWIDGRLVYNAAEERLW